MLTCPPNGRSPDLRANGVQLLGELLSFGYRRRVVSFESPSRAWAGLIDCSGPRLNRPRLCIRMRLVLPEPIRPLSTWLAIC
jgi:hypothetical protein